MTGEQVTVERRYDLHGVGVGVRCDDPAVAEALELRLRDFRAEPAGRVDVRLEFASGAPNGTHPPARGGRPVYDTPFGPLRYFPKQDLLCGELGGVQLRCAASRGLAQFHSAAFAGQDLYLATHPLATISLMELLERRGLFSLHAACLAGEDGSGVLLAGASGAGKSTLALALARANMSFLSDDLVFLGHNGDGSPVRVMGFADSIGVTERAGERYADLRALLGEPPEAGFPKRLARIEELFGAGAVSSCAPRALVFPEVARDRLSEIKPLDGGDALVRLVPDVLLTEPATTQAHLEAIASLLGQVRCYELRSGSDLERAAELVKALV
jgi:hypothetical protein